MRFPQQTVHMVKQKKLESSIRNWDKFSKFKLFSSHDNSQKRGKNTQWAMKGQGHPLSLRLPDMLLTSAEIVNNVALSAWKNCLFYIMEKQGYLIQPNPLLRPFPGKCLSNLFLNVQGWGIHNPSGHFVLTYKVRKFLLIFKLHFPYFNLMKCALSFLISCNINLKRTQN